MLNIFRFGSSCNRMLNPQEKLYLELNWSPTFFPPPLEPTVFPLSSTHSSIHYLSCLLSLLFPLPLQQGNELHEAVRIDILNCTNEDRDPQAAPPACSSPGVNGSNFPLINHISSNWLLIASSVVLGSSPSLFMFLRLPLLSRLKSAAVLICCCR